MQIESYIQAVREDLTRIAAVGDESTVRAAELLAVALDASLARRLQEAMTEAALELSGQLEEGRVEVRIIAGDPELVYVADGRRSETTNDAADEVFSARVTLRLSESLKARIEDAALSSGVSVNTWIVRALGRAVTPRESNRHRLTGYGRA